MGLDRFHQILGGTGGCMRDIIQATQQSGDF